MLHHPSSITTNQMEPIIMNNPNQISRDEELRWEILVGTLVSSEECTLLGDDSIISLEDAGLEEQQDEAVFGQHFKHADDNHSWFRPNGGTHVTGGINELVDWWSDGEDSRYESN